MSRLTAARAVTALTQGDPEQAAAIVNELPHDVAIASLLDVASVTARFAADQTGIPTDQLLTAIGEHP